MRQRDRFSGQGLLPRMEARPRKDGKTTYRYHPLGGKPVALGTDKSEAIRAVLAMNGRSDDSGTFNELWRLYKESPYWLDLGDGTRRSYEESSKPLLKVFGEGRAALTKPADVARYLRIERREAPVSANREVALLSNLCNLAVERGEIDANPCKQVRRNKEQPSTELATTEDLQAFITWAWARGGQPAVLAGMAEFCAIAGSRRIEFRPLHWTQVHDTEVRCMRAKQRGKVVVEVIDISERMAALLARLRPLARDPRIGAVFPNRDGNPHTDRGFKSAWARLMKTAIKAGVLKTRIQFHGLRAYFTTHYKAQHGQLPDLHANPATTARVYDRSTEVKRRSL
jgi:integrase